MLVPLDVKMFTHNDLDGVSCIVVAKYFFKHVSYEICDYKSVNDKIKGFFSEFVNKRGDII
ncbi:hypothetical protein ETC00_19880, partial [Brevibacillus sp. MCWH]|nr:hypothetical protein [Brevibacillus sp. MCWH]